MTDRSKRIPAIVAASVAAVVCAGLSLANLRAIAVVPTVAIPLSVPAVTNGAIVSITTRQGLPEYELHWDGQPPAAVLVDRARDAVVAAPAFSDDTFNRNRNAVRFVAGEVRIKVDARNWAADTPLELRVEAVPSRRWFHVFAVCAFLSIVAIVALLRVRSSDAIILLIAAAVFAAHYPGSPVRVSDSSDEANINSFAAGTDHPEWFTHDKLLSTPSNFSWYVPAYVSLLRVVSALGFHYATAYAFLGSLIVVLLFFGLQRLFSEASGSPRFGLAAAFTLGLMWDQGIPAGEEWLLVSSLPRALFTAILPWILLLALQCAPSSRRWWVATVAAGLLTHFYPLSGPVLIGALIVAFVVASDEPWKARLLGASIASAGAVIAMAPYVLIYSERYAAATATDPVVAARAHEITLLGYAHLQPGLVIEQLLRHRVETLRILFDLFALGLLLRCGFQRSTRFLLGLAVGFAIVAFGLPMIDAALARELGRRPYQVEMVRAVRYFDLFVVGALAVAVKHWRGSAQRARQLALAGAAITILAFAPGWLTTTRAVLGRARLDWRLLQNQPDASSAAAQEAVRAVQALRRADERVAGPVGLREFGVPLAWTWKDVLLLAYSSAPALLESAAAQERAQPLLERPITMESLNKLSRVLEAQLFFLPRAQVDHSLAASEQLLFENDAYAVIRVINPHVPR